MATDLPFTLGIRMTTVGRISIPCVAKQSFVSGPHARTYECPVTKVKRSYRGLAGE